VLVDLPCTSKLNVKSRVIKPLAVGLFEWKLLSLARVTVFSILLRRSRQFLCCGAVKNRGRGKREPERLERQRSLKNSNFQVPKKSQIKPMIFWWSLLIERCLEFRERLS